MAVFLGTLEYVLEEGAEQRLVPGRDVIVCGIVALVAGARRLLLARLHGATSRSSILRLRDRNFAVGSLFSFVLGIGLYGLTYLYPVYLGRVRGYDCADDRRDHVRHRPRHVPHRADRRAGCRRKLDPRVMMVIGFVGFAIGTWMMTGITKDWDFWELLVPADPARLRR